MEQVKVFYGCANYLETQINDWLKKMDDTIEITRVTQVGSTHLNPNVTTSIFYKTKQA